MKKVSNILIILGLLVTAFMATSCGKLDRTYNTWYKYDNTISQLPIGTAGKYTIEENGNPVEKDGSGMLENATLYVKFNDTDGLTIRAITTTKQTVGVAGGYFEIPDVTIVTGFEKRYGKEDFGPVRWTALISLGAFVEEDPPAQWNDISNIANAKLNLKRLVTDFLLQLLGVY